MSRRACQLFVDRIIEDCKNHRIGQADFYNSYLNDMWLSALVVDGGLSMSGSKDMVHLHTTEDVGPRKNNSIISAHLSTIVPSGYVYKKDGRDAEHAYSPEYLLQKHREWVNS